MTKPSMLAWCLVLSVTAVGCASPGTLDLEAAPLTISAATGSVSVVLHATTGAGLVGSGTVTLTSSVGSARAGLMLPLDAYGSARVDLTCSPADDPNCDTSPSMDLTASWVSAGKTVTADASIRLVASTATETNCADGKDNDLDGLIDCADPDCDAQHCQSADKCVTLGTCAQKKCVGGSPVTCTTPPSPSCQTSPGTCDHALGCVYQPKNVGSFCNDGDLCTHNEACDATGKCVGTPTVCPTYTSECHQAMGVCDSTTGLCSNPPVGDETACSSYLNGRCCGGTCTNPANDPFNCGSCGVRCMSGTCLPDTATNPAPTCAP